MIFLALLRYFLYFSISASFAFLASSREESWLPFGWGRGKRGEGGGWKREVDEEDRMRGEEEERVRGDKGEEEEKENRKREVKVPL